jgi:hypothetical protein
VSGSAKVFAVGRDGECAAGAGIGSGGVVSSNTIGKGGSLSVSGDATVVAVGGTLLTDDGNNGYIPTNDGASGVGCGTTPNSSRGCPVVAVGSGTLIAVGGGNAYGIGHGNCLDKNCPDQSGGAKTFITGGNVYASSRLGGKTIAHGAKNGSNALYPTYIPKSIGKSGTLTLPKAGASGALASDYTAPLADYAALLTKAGTFSAKYEPIQGAPSITSLPGDDDGLAAVVWLPGSAYDPSGGSYCKTYENISWGGDPSKEYVANVCSQTPVYAPALDTNIVAEPYIGVNATTAGITLDTDADDVANGTLKTGSFDVKVRTNRAAGYKVMFKMLDGGNGANLVPASGSGLPTSAGILANTANGTLNPGTFGLLFEDAPAKVVAPTESTVFGRIDTSDVNAISYAHPMPMSQGRTLRMWAAFKPAANTSAGTYSGTAVVTITANTP